MLTRKMLKAMGIEEEKIDQIIEAHTETTDALKADREKYKEEVDALKESAKEDAKTLKSVQKELEELKGSYEELEPYKAKYEEEHKAFGEFKTEVEAERTTTSKTTAYKALLKKAGVSDKRFDAIVRLTDLDKIELDSKGEVKDADKVVENIKEEWSEYIETKATFGAKTENPPANTGGSTMTKEEILKIKDRGERQKAISENHELFGY